MTEKTAKSVNNLGYHAHLYYDPTSTRGVAEGVCAALGEHFQVEIDGISVNGIDMIKWDDEGRITEFKVMIRPLKAINLIHQKMAAMLEAMKKR